MMKALVIVFPLFLTSCCSMASSTSTDPCAPQPVTISGYDIQKLRTTALATPGAVKAIIFKRLLIFKNKYKSFPAATTTVSGGASLNSSLPSPSPSPWRSTWATNNPVWAILIALLSTLTITITITCTLHCYFCNPKPQSPAPPTTANPPANVNVINRVLRTHA